MVHAEKWGYHPTGGFQESDSARTASEPGSEKWFALTGSRDENLDSGPGGSAKSGKTVPGGGCRGGALLALTGSRNGVIGDASLATDLKFETLLEGQKDPRTLHVFKLWSRCMRGFEYSYGSPLEALGDRRWAKTKLPSGEEIATAVADQKCRIRSNVVGVWFIVDFEAQEKAVAGNKGRLREVREQLRRQVRAARKILG
jgi:hypothetical protein